MYIEHVERPGRRTGDVAAVEIVGSVMTGAPDLTQIAAILYSAAEVGAGSRERAIAAVVIHDQESGTASEAEDFSRIRLHLDLFRCDNLIAAEIHHCRWNKIAEHGIDESRQ